MTREKAVVESAREIKIRDFGIHQWKQLITQRPASEKVAAAALGSSGAGPAKNDTPLLFDHQRLRFVQERGDLLDFIDNNRIIFPRRGQHDFSKQRGIGRKAP